MNKYQEYLNDQYSKDYDDVNLLTDEEVALMNPAGKDDEVAYWYQKNFGPVVDAQRKVDLLTNYIWHCRNLLSNSNLSSKDRDKLNSKIGFLVLELNKAKKELAHAKYNSDELNTLFNRR